VYVALSALVLGLFAIPLWYVWRVNYSTLRTYIDAEDVRTMVDTFEREGPTGLAAAIEARVRILPRDEILLLADPFDQIVPIAASAHAAVKLAPQARLKVYPGAPHGLCSTHKDQINADLLEFLKS